MLWKPLNRCFRLKKKYNEFNKDLKMTGAGKMYEELQQEPEMELLIKMKLEAFPWWPDLHGWWRTNPAFNTAFMTADPGQDFASAALQHFQVSSHKNLIQPCVLSDNDNADGSDIEDREIVGMDLEYDDTHQCQEDDMVIEQTDQPSHFKSTSHPQHHPVPVLVTLPHSPLLPCHTFILPKSFQGMIKAYQWCH
ncbi:hypothetical protein AZE42_11093 [Rhizopogon vesiculosus]|uniref:Uncharacterized protein n=1 Tax=Rhizopogon vesiculosus TaxID=180088 RepID=A0A1J8QWL5_9AGAM|nr:hypothetical protein AZE42_11093 [Rhizopogon vesiculosus]